MAGNVRTSVDVLLKPNQAFDALVDELSLGLGARGIKVDKLSRGGRITEAEAEVGVIDEWVRGKRISILWKPKTWEEGTTTKLAISFARAGREPESWLRARTGRMSWEAMHQSF